MKITSVECYLGSFITIKVNTDEGISGFGEAGVAYGNCIEAGFGQCQDFAKLIIGMDPFNTEAIWEHLHRCTFWGMGGGAVINSAMSAIDIACWDIKGKKLGVPVYQLLGGKQRSKLRAYASQLQFGWRSIIEKADNLQAMWTPEDYYDATKDAVNDGFDAIKVDPVFMPPEPKPIGEVFFTHGTHYYGSMKKKELDMAVARIAACREAGGDDLDIIVEIHSLLDANTAVQLGKLLEPYRIMYYEEPTMPRNVKDFTHIKNHCEIPLATGERLYTRWAFRPFLEERCVDVIQPDLCNTGGITEIKKIIDMADVYDIATQIHVCGGPIATAAALQVEAAMNHFLIHEEHNANMQTKFKNAGKYYYAPVNGYYTVPDLPGIGQEMSEYELQTARKVVIE